MRSAAPSDPLAELIEKRRRELQKRIPSILVPHSLSFGGGETTDEFLGLGVPLYVDSIVAQIRAPIDAEQTASSGPVGAWYDTKSNGVVEIRLLQFKGAVDIPIVGFNTVTTMSIPVYAREPAMQLVRQDGNAVDPRRPLIASLRVVWPGKATFLPSAWPVFVDVTTLFLVQAIPRRKV